MPKGCWWQELWLSATAATGRDEADREPLSGGYLRSLAQLLLQRKLRLATFLWALRARPASVCGVGGTYAVASWIN